MPVAARKVETAMVQHAHDLRHGAELQEHLEDKPQPFLNRHVGILDDHTARIADEADRQSERELTALGLGEEACGQPTADRVQFKLRYRPLQTEEETPVGATRIIYAVAIGDEAATQATNVQQRIPIGTIARQTRHVD